MLVGSLTKLEPCCRSGFSPQSQMMPHTPDLNGFRSAMKEEGREVQFDRLHGGKTKGSPAHRVIPLPTIAKEHRSAPILIRE